MSVLTEHIVLSRTRCHDLKNVKKLNCWGSELVDVAIVKRMPNVEVLSLSLNNITTLYEFHECHKLQELYLRKNQIKDLNELLYLKDLVYLRKLWLAENPCAERDKYRLTVLKALPNLSHLDNVIVEKEEVNKAMVSGDDLTWPGEEETKSISSASCGNGTLNGSNEEVDEIVDDDINAEESPTEMESVHQTPASAPATVQREYHPHQRYSYPDTTWTTGHGPIESTPQASVGRSNSHPPPQQSSAHMIRSASISDYSVFNGNANQSMIHHHGNVSNGSMAYETSYYSNNNVGDNTNRSAMSSAMVSGYTSPATSAPGATGHHYKANHYQQQQVPQRLLLKGGKNRNSNILSAVLCLIKELDYGSLEVVDTAIHCRMEEMDE